jgi:hypothetical protein
LHFLNMHCINVNSTMLSNNYINLSYIQWIVIFYYTTHNTTLVYLCFPTLVYFDVLIYWDLEIVWYDWLGWFCIPHFQLQCWPHSRRPYDSWMLHHPLFPWPLQLRALITAQPRNSITVTPIVYAFKRINSVLNWFGSPYYLYFVTIVYIQNTYIKTNFSVSRQILNIKVILYFVKYISQPNCSRIISRIPFFEWILIHNFI